MDLIDRIRSLVNVKKRIYNDGTNVIEVTESETERTMRFNNIVYSRVNKNIYTHQYWDFFVPMAKLYPEPRMLMIGLGAGTVPYQMSKLMDRDYSIDIVEISKPIIDDFKASQAASDPHIRIIHDDGAGFVRGNRDSYDIIILDAFVDATIPSQFFSNEFIASASGCLKENGILAINYLNPGNGSTTMEEYIARLERFFKVYRIRVSGIALNIVLLCSKRMLKDEIVSKVKSDFRETSQNGFILREYEHMW